MAFARVAEKIDSSGVRMLPVDGGYVRDSVDSAGHTAKTHQGADIFAGKSAAGGSAAAGAAIGAAARAARGAAGENGTDIAGGSGRLVRAASELQIIRVIDARDAAKGTPRFNAGPLYLDAYELQDGQKTGLVERYLHLDKVEKLKQGQVVAAGNPLGTYWAKTNNGGTGHLHFEIRGSDGKESTYGEVYDPVKWLRGALAIQTNSVRLVCQLNQEAAYKALKVGDTVYAKSGHRIQVLKKAGYPFFTGRVLDKGKASGEVTRDIGEAADWTLDQAQADTDYSVAKDGLLGLNAWAYRVTPFRKQIAAARSEKDPEKRYAQAWDIRLAIAGIRDEGFLTSQAESFKAAAATGATMAKDAARDIAGGIWDNIPASVKVIGGAVAGLGIYSILKGRD